MNMEMGMRRTRINTEGYTDFHGGGKIYLGTSNRAYIVALQFLNIRCGAVA